MKTTGRKTKKVIQLKGPQTLATLIRLQEMGYILMFKNGLVG
jgi:hypothetical protein